MDSFREKQWKPIGPGGFGCSCCNGFHGKKHKKKLNRKVRKEMRKKAKKILEND